jgi:hypothetical protein
MLITIAGMIIFVPEGCPAATDSLCERRTTVGESHRMDAWSSTRTRGSRNYSRRKDAHRVSARQQANREAPAVSWYWDGSRETPPGASRWCHGRPARCGAAQRGFAGPAGGQRGSMPSRPASNRVCNPVTIVAATKQRPRARPRSARGPRVAPSPTRRHDGPPSPRRRHYRHGLLLPGGRRAPAPVRRSTGCRRAAAAPALPPAAPSAPGSRPAGCGSAAQWRKQRAWENDVHNGSENESVATDADWYTPARRRLSLWPTHTH